MAAYSARVQIPFAFSYTQGPVYLPPSSGGTGTTPSTVLDPVINTPITVTHRVSGGSGPPATIYEGEQGAATYSSVETDRGGNVPGWVDPGSYQVTAAPVGSFAGATVNFEAVRGDGVTLIAPGAVGPTQLQSSGDYTMDGLTANKITVTTLTATTETVADLTAGEVTTDRLAVHDLGKPLPPSAIDGEYFVYQVDAARGIDWQFRYNAESTSPYKWEFIGGSALTALDNTGLNVMTAGLNSALFQYQAGTTPTVTPALTAPLAGEYVCEIWAVNGTFVLTTAYVQFIPNNTWISLQLWCTPLIAGAGAPPSSRLQANYGTMLYQTSGYPIVNAPAPPSLALPLTLGAGSTVAAEYGGTAVPAAGSTPVLSLTQPPNVSGLQAYQIMPGVWAYYPGGYFIAYAGAFQLPHGTLIKLTPVRVSG